MTQLHTETDGCNVPPRWNIAVVASCKESRVSGLANVSLEKEIPIFLFE